MNRITIGDVYRALGKNYLFFWSIYLIIYISVCLLNVFSLSGGLSQANLVAVGNVDPVRGKDDRRLEVFLEERPGSGKEGGGGQEEIGCRSDVEYTPKEGGRLRGREREKQGERE